MESVATASCLGSASVTPFAQELTDPVWNPSPEQRRILVTGGTGLLGRPLVEELSKRGFAVATISTNTFDRMHAKVKQKFVENNVATICLDLAADVKENDGQQLCNIIEADRIELLINLAADRGGVKWDGSQRKMNHPTLNVGLPQKLAQISQDTGLAVFHISTEYVFSGEGNSETGYPALPVSREDNRFVKPSRGTPYALQKFEAEEFLKGRDRITMIRIPVLYGEMNSPLEDGTASASINNFLGDNTFQYDTWQRRYPTCAEDVAYIISSLAYKHFQSGLSSQIYHYGAQKCVSKYDFVDLFARTAGFYGNQLNQLEVHSEDVSEKRPREKWPPYDVRLDHSATQSELGDLWREPRELTEAEINRVWLPHFQSQVDDHKMLEAVRVSVRHANQKLNMELGRLAPRVCIIGDEKIKDQAEKTLVKVTAAKCGEHLRDLAVFITEGCDGVQRTFAEHYDGDVWKQMPDDVVGHERGNELPRVDDAEKNQRIVARLGHAYLLFGGGTRELNIARDAHSLGALVLPLGPREGSERTFRRDHVPKEQWTTLTNPQASAEEVAQAVVDILRPELAKQAENLERVRPRGV